MRADDIDCSVVDISVVDGRYVVIVRKSVRAIILLHVTTDSLPHLIAGDKSLGNVNPGVEREKRSTKCSPHRHCTWQLFSP